LPNEWSALGLDKTRKGHPYRFGSPKNSILYVHVNDVTKDTTDVSLAPDDLSHAQKVSYEMAVEKKAYDIETPLDPLNMDPDKFKQQWQELIDDCEKRKQTIRVKLTRITRGNLVGFDVTSRLEDHPVWSGLFGIHTHLIVARLEMIERDDKEIDQSIDILATLSIHRAK